PAALPSYYAALTSASQLSLHDALPIAEFRQMSATSDQECPFSTKFVIRRARYRCPDALPSNTWVSSGTSRPVSAGDVPLETHVRSEEHTSELQSRFDLVSRLLIANKNT